MPSASDEAMVDYIQTETAELAENGLGFGEGSIGVQDRLVDSSDGLDEDIVGRVKEGLRSSNALIEVSKDDNGRPLKDDGCGDGRGVVSIFDQQKEYSRSLYRPKVFGGGAIMGLSALVGLGKVKGKSPDEAFSIAVETMNSNGIEYGGHYDDHASGDNCGCGAIDKSEDIICNVSKYGEQIADTVFSVARAAGEGAETFGEDIDFVMGNFRAFGGNCDGKSKGTSKFELVRGSNKVIKELKGAHKEIRIALNTVDGYTVDQEYIRNLSGGEAQVFAVDIWRLADLSGRLSPDGGAERRRAFLSMLAYTSATAATLTKGDLPVDLIAPRS